ncbi:MAG: UDP-N-acetylglucosamine 2-epimerase (non-hydrolyzing) [Bacteroidota bacterium]
MNVLTVIGARPQFVKAGPLSKALRRAGHREVIVHTGQHYDAAMSDQIFTDLEIPAPDYNLDVRSGSHGAQTGRMLAALEEVLLGEQPDLVIVFGDTNTTIAAALAAVKLHQKVLHIEAGLRSFNRAMPEEINRVLTDHCSDFLFAPTDSAVENLTREGLAHRTYRVGDIMVDSLLDRLEIARERSDILARVGVEDGGYYLLTLHRPYNVDDPKRLAAMLGALGRLGRPVVFPAHPRTRAVLEQHALAVPEAVRLLEPQGFLDFVRLEAGAVKILTDSGGVQKEAYILGTPCVTLRPETEWVETIEAGWNVLADPEDAGFADLVLGFDPVGAQPDLFGRNVAEEMVRCIERVMEDNGGVPEPR